MCFANKKLKVVLPGVHSEYDPAKIWVTDQWFVLQNLGLTLVGRNISKGFYGRAASYWKVGEDNKGIKIKLRDNLKFSNGDLITSSHVALSLKRLILLSPLSYQIRYMIVDGDKLKDVNDSIKGIKILSENEIEISFNAPFVKLLHFLSRIENSIIHPTQIGKNLIINNWNVASGPYYMEDRGTKKVLKKNKYYLHSNQKQPETIEVVGMQLDEGYNVLKNNSVDIVNFGAVFDSRFKNLEKSTYYKTLDFNQLSSCYFQINSKKIENFSLETRRFFFKKIRSLNWKPYDSNIFSSSDQFLTSVMQDKLSHSEVETIEMNWKIDDETKKYSLNIFYPEFFGEEYKQKILSNFKKLGFKVDLRVIPIERFLEEFKKDWWDILFTMMEMPSSDIRLLYSQVFNDGGMKLADPLGLGKSFLKKKFKNEEELLLKSKALARYIHEEVLIIPLFTSRWPYYVKKEVGFNDSEPYELDFKLWKIENY